MALDLLTIGDCAIDQFMSISQDSTMTAADRKGYPEICFYHGSKIPVDHFETSIAGNALNLAVGCKYLGLKTGIYSELGKDVNSARIISELKAIGVDTACCEENTGTPTNVHAVIIYGADRTIFSYHEKRRYGVEQFEQHEKPTWIYYTSIGPDFAGFQDELVAYTTRNPGVGVAFNPGTLHLRAGVDAIRNVLTITDILFVNKEEAIRLTQDPGYEYETLHKKLQQLGPKLTVITDATNGATAYDGTNLIKSGIYSDDRPQIDKTGAGDAFASGFLAAIFYKKSLKEALTWGVVNAGCKVKAIGTIKGILKLEEMKTKVGSLLK
jgi:ribokinase